MAFLIKAPIKSEPFYEGPGYNKRVKLQEQAAKWERELQQLKSEDQKEDYLRSIHEKIMSEITDPQTRKLHKAIYEYGEMVRKGISELKTLGTEREKMFEKMMKDIDKLKADNNDDLAKVRQQIKEVERRVEEMYKRYFGH